MQHLFFAFLLSALLLCPVQAHAAVPFWGAGQSSPVDTPPAALKPGEWLWGGSSTGTAGPMAVIVSLTEQRAYVYRNGLLIGVSTVSTGKPGYETPTGVFTILQKDKDHRSNKYNNAPMPYQQRLTWDGVALHAGGLPGYPESHGCVHLPTEFARLLFDASAMGMTVVVSEEGRMPVEVVHPGLASPVDPAGGGRAMLPSLQGQEAYRWEPSRAGTGPVSMVMSLADRMLFVYRNGVEIGRARVDLRGDALPTGVHAYIVAAEPSAAPEAAITRPTWIAIGLPGHAQDAGQPLTPEQAAQVGIADSFREAILPLLKPGTVVVVTDAPVLPTTTGATLQVLDSDPPAP